ncbi:unnamed protein product [Euphydryas editha]|uniref:Uncharacterized protein n=1 Tax=Euphydryas editha TaxID=104508 RepID=A0AAU9U6H7_EUPED|nr:unnamed protein product [Euphydryas editha]
MNQPKTKVDNDDLKDTMEAVLSYKSLELAVAFNIYDKTVLIVLRQIGKINKYVQKGFSENLLNLVRQQ